MSDEMPTRRAFSTITRTSPSSSYCASILRISSFWLGFQRKGTMSCVSRCLIGSLFKSETARSMFTVASTFYRGKRNIATSRPACDCNLRGGLEYFRPFRIPRKVPV